MEEKQRIIIFSQVQASAHALNAYVQVSSQQPNQDIGEEFAVQTNLGGYDFLVIRNEDSYTIEEI